MASKPVVVFSKSYCPYCTKAKTALNAVGAKFEVRHAVLKIRLGKRMVAGGANSFHFFSADRHIFECRD